MNVTFAPGGILQIDEARLIYRNFSGEASKYNREGDRNFAIIIPDQDIADALIKEGWNVKIKQPREGWNVKIKQPRDEGDEPFMYLSVKVKFNNYGPNVYLMSGSKMIRLNEESVGCLDKMLILSADLDIRPYDWEVNGRAGRTAYLQSAKIIQRIDDRFREDYDNNRSF